MSAYIVELSAVLVFFIGFYGLITSRRIIKSIASITLMEIAIVVFFLSFGFSRDVAAPIGEDLVNVADPLPQALVITSIVIGVAVSAISLTMMISIFNRNKAIEWDEIEKEVVE